MSRTEPLKIDFNDVTAAAYEQMSPEDKEEQMVSFTWGNLVLDGCEVTKEFVREVVRKHLRGAEKS